MTSVPPRSVHRGRCRPALALLLALAAAAGTGCLAPGAGPSPRWFRPPPPGPPSAPTEGSAPALRLRPPEAAPRLGDRIAWRTSDVEFGRHELLRWTDPPAAYLRQALESALFGGGRLERSDRASAPVLETCLVAFDDVRDGSGRDAGVAVVARLASADGRTLLSREYESTRAVSGEGPEPLVRELGAALHEVAERLARDVADALATAGAAAGA